MGQVYTYFQGLTLLTLRFKVQAKCAEKKTNRSRAKRENICETLNNGEVFHGH